MAKRGFEDFHPVIVKCGILITALSHQKIRVKDILFHISLVKDIFRSSNHFQDFDLQAVQVIRFFEKLKSKGWAEIESEGSVKVFRLKEAGIFDIFGSLVTLEYILPAAEAIFLQGFIDSYGGYIHKFLVKALTPEQMGQLKLWLTPGFIQKQQLRAIDAGLLDLGLRMRDAVQLQAYINDARKRGLNPAAIIEGLPSDFSYRLSHQKRLKEWLLEMPPELATYEIETGLELRQRNLYQPSFKHLEMLKQFYTEEFEKNQNPN